MAGNLVKWWKHKILGGYKQFSVQECTTDSEELMYHQVRASSSCSAPPDLLLVSDRENNIPLRSPVVNIIAGQTSTTAPATLTTTSPSSGINACPITSASNNNQRHHQKLLQQQQQHQHHSITTQQLSLAYNGTKDVNGKHQKNISGISSSSNKHGQQQQQQQQHTHHQQQQQQQDMPQQQQLPPQENEGQEAQTTSNNHSSTRHAHQSSSSHHPQQHQRNEEQHIRLEEFTCDVSVEGGKSSQPLQFSFTFYDLDGHHGKITKDDIVGIVYTIYESIGKSVVVPHSGSKTINVRLTVSPEGKSKAAKTKKSSTNGLIPDHTHHQATAQQKASVLANASSHATRRLHRYRPRKLIKSDDEDDDSNSDKERENSNLSNGLVQKSSSKSHKFHKLKVEQQCCPQQQQQQHVPASADLQNSPLESIYDNIKPVTTPEACRECLAAVDESRNSAISPTTAAAAAAATQFHNNSKSVTNEAYMKHVASTRIKMLRKSRKQKHQDCIETRQRSLSVGNETCWKNRHLQKQPTQQQLQWHAEQQLNNTVVVDTVDGVQLRNPLKTAKAMAMSQKRNSAECWKTALNRNDLISIIRESMEKNRLCFQLNGKPQANVSPIRHSQQQQQQQHHQQHLLQHHKHSQQHPQTQQTHRQRSNTVSKIPTLIANHNNVHSVSPQSHYAQRSSSCTNNNNSSSNMNINNDTNLHEHHNNTSSNNSIYHLQPHIPIYHQQMAINPAVIAAQNALSTNNAGGVAAGHHSKMNLCGYDSFLHATICGGGLSHSPPPPPHTVALNNQTTNSAAAVGATSPTTAAAAIATASGHYSPHQQIATVQPIMSSASTNLHNTPKHLGLAVTPNQIKTSKILRSGSYAQSHQPSAANSASPQYHGYQRLPSSSKHNLAALHLVSPTMEKPQLDQLDKWRRDQVKNYDQLLYAKLSEKLQQTNLVAPSRENREQVQRRKHRMLRQRRNNAIIAEANNISLPTVLTNKIMIREDSDYATMIPINGDPIECENLIGQTSDEESHSQHEQQLIINEVHKDTNHTLDSGAGAEHQSNTRHVVEGTLVDLDDMEDQESQSNNIPKGMPLNVDTLLTVEGEDHELHLVEDLENDEDLEEDLDDLEEELVGVNNASGRQSAASNDTNTNGGGVGGATIANTNNGANTSTTSSLIHRYVHEHIHHHYHHFEEKEE